MSENTTMPRPAAPASPSVLHPDSIPAELRSSRRWVGWVENGCRKSFVNCRTGQPVGIGDVAEFVQFEEAVDAHGRGDITGLAYASDGAYSVIRMPGFRLVRRMAPKVWSYAELAVCDGASRLSAQVIVRATLPPGTRRGKDGRHSRYWTWELTTGPQFIPLAGKVIPECPRTIEDFQGYIEKLSRRGTQMSAVSGRVAKG